MNLVHNKMVSSKLNITLFATHKDNEALVVCFVFGFGAIYGALTQHSSYSAEDTSKSEYQKKNKYHIVYTRWFKNV